MHHKISFYKHSKIVLFLTCHHPVQHDFHHCYITFEKENRKKMSTFTFYKYNDEGRIGYHNMKVNIEEKKIKFIETSMSA